MAARADRDSLFGVLALELGFITSDDLNSARKAREIHPEEPLGRLLVDRQVLGGEECALLDALVDHHLRRNGNDPEQSLAALRKSELRPRSSNLPQTDVARPVAGEPRSHFSGADIPPTLAGPPDEHATAGPDSDPAGATAPPRAQRPRFRILRHHASGGLGRVFVAYDQELNREVALKEIHARYAHLADCRARFLLEAEVTGRLEHPGIVPVYGLGRYDDGLPYYAMRLIQGESLKEAIQTFHQTRFADAGQRTLALRHLLAAFLAVCQAVRYAHSRGIVHRDLKPENVMLGKFGETLVVDWGLAKPVDSAISGATLSGAETADGPLHPEPDGVPLVTRAGTILGTPGYMSPEQADGMLHEVSPASDVYSLGATLYTILTGQAPMTAKDLAGALEEGSKGKFPPPRALDRRVPRALEAVCLKAMALLPRDRYEGVRELADDLERWLADEPVAAYREPPIARVGRWLRRHPARVASLTAAVLVGAIGLLIGVVVVSDRNRELAAANDRESDARRQADIRFREAQGAVNEFFTEISENNELLKKQPGTQALRRQLLEKARDYYEGFLRERGGDPAVRAEAAAAHCRVGAIANSLSPGSQKAVDQYEQGLAVLQPLLGGGPSQPQLLLLQAKLYWGLGMALGRADRFDEARASFEKGRKILERLVSEHPATPEYAFHLAKTFGGFAYVQGGAHRGEEALAANARAAVICERLVKECPDVADYAERLAITHLNIGADQKDVGNYPEALRSVSRALAVAERLVENNPGVAQYVQVVVYAFNNMGHYQSVLGQRDEALSTFARGVEVAERLARENPGVPDYSNILAYMLYNRGVLELRQGMTERANASLSRGKGIIERLTLEYPAQHQYSKVEAQIAENIGWACHASGREDEASAAFSRSLAIWERLAVEDPKVTGPASSAAWLRADCPVPALRDPARAGDLARQCLRQDPLSAAGLVAYGLARYRAGDAREAVGALEKGLNKLADADEARPTAELVLVMARWHSGQRDSARELFARSAALNDKSGLQHPEYRALRQEAAHLLGTEPFPARQDSAR
jgi:serine/threonine-protein kinase